MNTIWSDIEKLKLYDSVSKNIECSEYSDTVAGYWQYIENNINSKGVDTADSVYRELENYLETEYSGKLKKFMITVLLNHYKEQKYAAMLSRDVLDDNQDIDELYFTVQQLASFSFRYPGSVRIEDLESIYQVVLTYWKEKLYQHSSGVRVGDHNKYLVITTQLAGDRHAPTKTLWERVKTLTEYLKKNVFVIHTRETLTQREYFPFYNCMRGMVNEVYTGLKMIKISEGVIVPLYQPSNAMPNIDEFIEIFELVKQYQPGRVIVLGDYSLVGDVIADYIPTINISFGFSNLKPKRNQYVALFRSITDDDKQLVKSWNIDINRYISGLFTFNINDSKANYSREQFGIPEDAFVMVCVGNRLGSDLTREFIEMLEKIESDKWFVVLAGANAGSSFQTICEQYPFMKEHSQYLGYVDDIIALLRCCDLYVNPPRLGGGYSVAEAFYSGIPGVSLYYGDVAATAGNEFCVGTLDEMKTVIDKYISDGNFYKEMASKARERSELLIDDRAALANLLLEFEKRI